MSHEEQVHVVRQVRVVKLPVKALVDFLSRRLEETGEPAFRNPRVLEIRADRMSGQVILHLEHDSETSKAYEHDVDWAEVFGVVKCSITGHAHPVEEITVSREAGERMREELLRLRDVVSEEDQDSIDKALGLQ